MHPVIQAAVSLRDTRTRARQGGGGADTGVVSATTTSLRGPRGNAELAERFRGVRTPPVVVWAPGAPPAGVANRL